MPYYLKKDLPTIKAGTEILQTKGERSFWRTGDDNSQCYFVPPDVLNDWIEEREEEEKAVSISLTDEEAHCTLACLVFKHHLSEEFHLPAEQAEEKIKDALIQKLKH